MQYFFDSMQIDFLLKDYTYVWCFVILKCFKNILAAKSFQAF